MHNNSSGRLSRLVMVHTYDRVFLVKSPIASSWRVVVCFPREFAGSWSLSGYSAAELMCETMAVELHWCSADLVVTLFAGKSQRAVLVFAESAGATSALQVRTGTAMCSGCPIHGGPAESNPQRADGRAVLLL